MARRPVRLGQYNVTEIKAAGLQEAEGNFQMRVLPRPGISENEVKFLSGNTL